jgi:hypothetical protein
MMGGMEPADMMASVSASMKRRTGRTLDERVDLVRHAGLDPLQQNDLAVGLGDDCAAEGRSATAYDQNG